MKKIISLVAAIAFVLTSFLAFSAQAAEMEGEYRVCEHWRVIVYDNNLHQEVVEVQAVFPRRTGEVYEFAGKVFEEGRVRRMLLDTSEVPLQKERSNDLFVFRDKQGSEVFVLTTKKGVEVEKQKCQEISI